jgi:NAD(P)-dependent dehydrogenase (short-subunit alcohol dehydrogenase family)
MNKTILITGTSSGFGKATARLFANKGWNVVATMRRPEEDREFNQLPDVLVTRLDVQDRASIAGAHTIIVPNLQDISKLPVMSSNSIVYRGYISGKVGQFNTLLASTLNSIREANLGLLLIDADINTPLNNLIANPAAAGFTQATVDALDDTNLTDKSFTGPGSDYVFWNPDHPTSKTHQLIASWICASQQLIGPIPLSFQCISNSLVLSWTNSAFVLQSAPATTGTYTNIPGATSPYTNPITSGQQFFRLLNP